MSRDTGKSIEGHAKEAEIKRLLIGGLSLSEISRRTNINRHAVAAYRNKHFPEMTSSQELVFDADLIEQRLRTLTKDVEEVTADFKQALEDLRVQDASQMVINNTGMVFLKAADVQEKKYRTLLELGGQLLSKQLQLKLTQVNIYDSPQWVEVGRILDEELEPGLHDIRKRVGERLLELEKQSHEI